MALIIDPENMEVVFSQHALEYRVQKRFADQKAKDVFHQALSRFIHNSELMDWVVNSGLKVIFSYQKCKLVLSCKKVKATNKIIIKIITSFHQLKNCGGRKPQYNRAREKRKTRKILKNQF